MRFVRHILSSLPDYDWPLLLVTIVLMAIGLSAIYSVDLSRGSGLAFFPTQAIAAVLGVGVMIGAGFLHVSCYRFAARPVYVGSVLLLLAVLFFGVTVRGTTGWFRIFGVSFQPAEFAKVGLILALSFLIERYGRRFDRPQFVIATALFTALLVGLILLQPDAGSALILLCVWFGYVIFSGTKKRYVVGLLLTATLLSAVSWVFLLKPYQQERFLTFFHPERDQLGTGYNVTQSIIAVGSGEWLGRGLGFGSQSQLHFLPEAQTDFIFSVIAEELGFLGVIAVLSLYTFLLLRLIRTAAFCGNDFSAYTILGITMVLSIHLLINVGGAVGVLPLTGVTLPFLSYGGSSLLMDCFLIGIAESIGRSERTVHSGQEG